MIVSDIAFTRRLNGFHYFRGFQIEAVRVGNGVGVLVVFQPSQIDRDFKEALSMNELGLWSPSQDELEKIQRFLDESDHRTAKLLDTNGWGGRRPFKLEEFC